MLAVVGRDWLPEHGCWITWVHVTCDLCGDSLIEDSADFHDWQRTPVDTGWLDECPSCARRVQ